MNKRVSYKIPLMKPLLPTADKIVKYIEEIDKNRWYSNLGPLSLRLEEELAILFDVPRPSLICLANGTSALTVMLRSMNVEFGSLCIVPSWTFAATAAAATEVGMIPFFVDVEESSWALDPKQLQEQVKYIPGKVGAVIVVSPFGAPIPLAGWDQFTEATGIPVIIDAAAGFDSVLQNRECREGKTPIMISMHATKPFGIGEGAFAICHDKQIAHTIRQMANFGFTATREIVLPGINAKLNEYLAAVGLAALEEWTTKRERLAKVIDHYLSAVEDLNTDKIRLWLSRDWVTTVCNAIIPINSANTAIEQLALANIESRKWWAKGCHEQPAYKHCQHFATPITDKLSNSTIALPLNVDMSMEEIDYIVRELAHNVI